MGCVWTALQRPRRLDNQLARCFPLALGVILSTLALSGSWSGVFVRESTLVHGTVFPLGRPGGGGVELVEFTSLTLSRDPRKLLRLLGLFFMEADLCREGVGVVSVVDGNSGAEAWFTRRIVAGNFGGAKSEVDVARLEDGENGNGGRPTLTHGLTV